MLAGIKEQKYIYIKDFFSKEDLSILQPYCLNKTLFCTQENLQDPQCITSAWFYRDPIMNIMLLNKLKKAEEISKTQLLPTLFGEDILLDLFYLNIKTELLVK